MKTYSRQFAPDLTRQLEDAGVLTGDAKDGPITHPAPPGLLISQENGLLENSAFDLKCGDGAGYILSLHVAVDLPEFTIWGWQLYLPWGERHIQWLTEPLSRKFPNNMYQFPGCPDRKFAWDEAINHRRVLHRGHPLDGFLLGWGFASIPDSFHHGESIGANLVLVDELNRGFSTSVQFWLDRSAKIDLKRTKTKIRRRLLENQSRPEDELVLTQV